MRSESQLQLPIVLVIILFFCGLDRFKTGQHLLGWVFRDAEVVEASGLDIRRIDVFAGDGMSEEVYVDYAYEFEDKFEWRLWSGWRVH